MVQLQKQIIISSTLLAMLTITTESKPLITSPLLSNNQDHLPKEPLSDLSLLHKKITHKSLKSEEIVNPVFSKLKMDLQ